jgi:hypothetical protein
MMQGDGMDPKAALVDAVGRSETALESCEPFIPLTPVLPAQCISLTGRW